MRKGPRKALIVIGGGAAVLLGLAVFLELWVTDTITFTRKMQTVELPDGFVLSVYRTSKWEYYDCCFALRDRAGKVVIPKTHFYSMTYWTAGESTPETRTTFHALVGPKSGIVGLTAAEEKEIVLALVEPIHLQYVVATPVGLSAAEATLGTRLLSDLKRDFPDRKLALESTDEAAELRRSRWSHSLEKPLAIPAK